MVKKRRKIERRSEWKVFSFRRHRLKVLWDDAIILGFFKNLHGRFWGLAGMGILVIGVGICFLIRPDLISGSTALSNFGSDVRTAPYFAGAMFFSAYGLWRWRGYLSRTLKHTRPILFLMMLTILGLFIVALWPVSYKNWPYYVHIFGMSLIGISAGMTVIFDILLSKTRKNQNTYRTRLIKMLAFFLILIGGCVTVASTRLLKWLDISFFGETMLIAGYTIWIIIKTYQGEEPRSALSRLLRRIVLVD
jgi:hypothetical protein